MLRIWLSTNRKMNTTRILNEICSSGKKDQILLVPEQFSHMAEKQLLRHGGARINRYAQVLSFSRLASRVFSLYGGSAQSQTDASGKLLLMSLAVEQVHSRLKLYANSADKPAFLLKLIDTIEELRSFCVSAEKLRTAAAQVGGSLAVKMEEFSLLMESYDSVCANMGQNPESRLTRLLYKLDECDYAEGKTVYFDAFSDFNGIEQEIIASLLAGGADITVALHCDGIHSDAQQFNSARNAAKALVRLAEKQGLQAHISKLGDDTGDELQILKTRLFGGTAEPFDAETDRLVFIEGNDVVAECRNAAGEILKLIEDGARYRDITVACGQYDTYRPILETIFKRAQIPAYYAGDTSILQHKVVHMLLSALKAASGAMETETVLQYLKSGFLPIEEERCDRLENYVLLWGIRGAQWQEIWSKNPFGIEDRSNTPIEPLLQELNEDRVRCVMPLVHLRHALREAKNTAEMLVAFSDFMDSIELNERLNAIAGELFEQKQLQKAQQYAQVYSIVCRLLEQMHGVLGSSVRSPEGFYQMFRTALSQCSVGTIPSTLDSVNVGSLLSQRRGDSPYLFVLGANEGAFPAAQSNTSLLTDSERTSLWQCGIELTPRVLGSLDRELSAIAGTLEVPTKRLYFGGVQGTQAYYLLRAQKLFPAARRCTSDAALIERSERDHLDALVKTSMADDSEICKQARELTMPHELGALKEETVRALYGKELRLSSSKIDRIASCRLSYFLDYGLKAQERKEARVDPSTFGTFVHDVLEHTCKQVMDEGGFHVVTRERTEQIAHERMQWYSSEVLGELWQSERAKYLFERSFSEVFETVRQLWREMSVSEFEPKWFELGFGRGKDMPPVKIVGEKMTAYLDGVVDRADIWREGEKLYVRIVDYKTGSTSFSMEKILVGIGLQMLLYLFAMRRNGDKLAGDHLHCAGVMYFHANMKRIAISGKYDPKAEAKCLERERRSGMILNRESVLQAMEPGENKLYLPQEEYRATTSQFEELEEFVFSTVAALADELAQGVVEANPYYIDEYSNACGRCSFAELCRDRYEKRRLPTVKTAEEFWDKIGEVR